MFKFIALIILATATSGSCTENGNTLETKTSQDNNRQRRLLFYDEDGNLVKTYSNPYIHNIGAKNNNIFWNIMNPFFSFLRPSTFSGSAIAYMIPVSDAVIQQINHDPVYQNKLVLLSTRDPVVEPNPLCNGKREPIPSPKICNGFLNCWDGWAFEQECPDGLLFSNNGYCDYYHNVDCNNRKLKDRNTMQWYRPNQTLQESYYMTKELNNYAVEPRCRRDFETFRNDTNCNEFFVCVNSLPVRFKCPSDLYYNQYLGVCDYKHIVHCNASSTSQQSDPKPSSEATTIAAISLTTGTTTLSNESSSKPMTSRPGNILINSVYDSRTWTSMHVAMSRQDAIRQLKLQTIANVKTAD